MKTLVLLLHLMLCVIFFSCIDKNPDEETLLLYTRASSVYREGRYEEAASMLSAERKFLPSLVLRGKAQYFIGNDEEAEQALKSVLSKRPGNIEAGLYMARLEREKGNISDARQLVENILSDDPQNIRALRFAAQLSRDIGPEGEAASIAFLDQAAEASVESALVFIDRARSHWIHGNAGSALNDLARAKALLPENSPMFNSVSNLEAIISIRTGSL